MTLLTALSLSSLVSASPITSESELQDDTVITQRDDHITKTYTINKDLEVVRAPMGQSDAGSIIAVNDHNPTSYQSVQAGGHNIESWVDENTAYTKDNGTLTKKHVINKDLEIVRAPMGQSDAGSIVTIIDHNPSVYQKSTIAGHVLESWIEDGVVYTKRDGQMVKSYKINGDIQTIRYGAEAGDNAGSIKEVIDHNPNLHQTLKTEL